MCAVDGVACCPECWASVVVWLVLLDGVAAAPADGVGVVVGGVPELLALGDEAAVLVVGFVCHVAPCWVPALVRCGVGFDARLSLKPSGVSHTVGHLSRVVNRWLVTAVFHVVVRSFRLRQAPHVGGISVDWCHWLSAAS